MKHMDNYLFKKELAGLQSEYKEVLLKARDNIFTTDSLSVIDEINIFWQKNKRLVEFALKNSVSPYTTYVFTAACKMDMEDYEHYPFILLGNFHVWDDNICNYTSLIDATHNRIFNERVKKQIIDSITDNIQILEKAKDTIYILPVRDQIVNQRKMVSEVSLKAFFSLFQRKYDTESYNKYFVSIDDIESGLRPDVEQIITFTENENSSIDFKTRFNNYKNTAVIPFSDDTTDAKIFWFAMFSHLSQVFEILFMCSEYKIYPYIRFNVAINYMLIILEKFKGEKEIENIIFKGAVTYILHRTFDKERFRQIEFKRYYDIIQKFDFDEHLFVELERQGVSSDNINLKLIHSTVENLLEALIDVDDLKA